MHEGRQLLNVAHARCELFVHGRRVLVAHVQLYLLVDPEWTPAKDCQVSETFSGILRETFYSTLRGILLLLICIGLLVIFYLFLSLEMAGMVSPTPVNKVMRQSSLNVSMSVMMGAMLATRRSTSFIIRSVNKFVDLFVSKRLTFLNLKICNYN